MASFLNKFKKPLIVGFILVISIIFIKYQISNKKPKELFSQKSQVKKTTISKKISGSGKIQSNAILTLRFQTSGYLTYVGVKKGDLVKKGQLIGQLDKNELEKNLKKKLNDYLLERWNFEENKDVYKDKALTDTIKRILEANQFKLEKSVSDVEIADIALKFSNLYSPIDGVVIDIDSPTPGVNISPAAASFTVADYNNVSFIVNIDETDISYIKKGQEVSIKLDAYENQEFKGVVDTIGFSSTTTSSGNTAFPVEIKFPDNSSLRFKIGMNGDAEITAKTIKNALVIPVDFVFENSKEKYVYILENSKIKKRKIKTGIETETQVEIVNGLSENETIIIPID